MKKDASFTVLSFIKETSLVINEKNCRSSKIRASRLAKVGYMYGTTDRTSLTFSELLNNRLYDFNQAWYFSGVFGKFMVTIFNFLMKLMEGAPIDGESC